MQKSGKKFTLLELLLVIMLLAILGALLLPCLQKGLETAHRSVCLNNLSQQFTGVSSYIGDHAGLLPQQGSNIAAGIWADGGNGITTRTRYTYEADIASSYTKLSANAVFYKHEYWSADIINCPSMDCQLQLVPPQEVKTGTLAFGVVTPTNGPYSLGYTHYEYRFNFSRAAHDIRFTPRILASGKETGRALCWDQAASGRDSITWEPRRTSRHYSYAIAGPDITRLLKWSHQDGGNVLRMDGSAVWLDNRLHTGLFNPNPPDNCQYLSWPGIRWTYLFFCPSTQNGSEGIDFWMH